MQPGEGAHPAAHQRPHVLAGLHRGQERDPRPVPQAQAAGHPLPLVGLDGAEHLGVHAVQGDVDPVGVRTGQPHHLLAGGLDGTTQRAARRTARRVAARKVAAFTGRCTPGSVKNVASCSVTTLAAPGRAGAV